MFLMKIIIINYEKKKYESQVTDENPNPQDDHFVSLCMMELFIIMSVLLKQNPQKHIIFCINHW
jgi:hypothetical protein